MAEEYPIGWHEVLDRAHIAASMWSDFITDHFMVVSNPDVTEKAEQIEEAMAEFYQTIGRIIHDKQETTNGE